MQQMTIPDIGEWCSMTYAAEQLNVSLRTIGRLVADGRLVGQQPRLGTQETKRHKTLLYVPQVLEYKRARDMVSTPVRS